MYDCELKRPNCPFCGNKFIVHKPFSTAWDAGFCKKCSCYSGYCHTCDTVYAVPEYVTESEGMGCRNCGEDRSGKADIYCP